MTGTLLKYTDKLYDIIDDIRVPVAEKLMRIESDWLLDNYLKVELVDVSKHDFNFDVTISGQKQLMKVGKFIRYILPNEFTDKEIYDFISGYNRIKNGFELPDESKQSRYKNLS